MISGLGRGTLRSISTIGAMTLFGLTALGVSLFRAFSLRKLILYVYEIGVKCVPLVAIVGLFAGMVLGLQGYYTLVRFGSEGLLGGAVALTLIREIGPVFTAILVVGQAGSAMSAEIGIQRNSEQIDALTTMEIDPLGYLVGPRLLAALIAFPILTAVFDVIGIWGGYFTASLIIPSDIGTFWSSVESSVYSSDIRGGFVKALAFSQLSTLICCYEGFFTHLRATSFGARGVSQSATNAVVLSSIAILVADYLITSFLL